MNKILNFEQYYKINEEGEAGGGGDGGGAAGVNLGNIGGMGAVVPPVPSANPGQVWTGTPNDYVKGAPGGIGSGDVPAYDKGTHFGKNDEKKPVDKNKKTGPKNKKINSKGEANPYGWDKGYQSMYVTNFSDWTGTYKPNTVK